jgi:hypothetical protein
MQGKAEADKSVGVKSSMNNTGKFQPLLAPGTCERIIVDGRYSDSGFAASAAVISD